MASQRHPRPLSNANPGPPGPGTRRARPRTARGASAEAPGPCPPQRPGAARASPAPATPSERQPHRPQPRRGLRSQPESPLQPPLLTAHGCCWGGPGGNRGLGAAFARLPRLGPRYRLPTRSYRPRAGSAQPRADSALRHLTRAPDRPSPAPRRAVGRRPLRCHGDHWRRGRAGPGPGPGTREAGPARLGAGLGRAAVGRRSRAEAKAAGFFVVYRLSRLSVENPPFPCAPRPTQASWAPFGEAAISAPPK